MVCVPLREKHGSSSAGAAGSRTYFSDFSGLNHLFGSVAPHRHPSPGVILRYQVNWGSQSACNGLELVPFFESTEYEHRRLHSNERRLPWPGGPHGWSRLWINRSVDDAGHFPRGILAMALLDDGNLLADLRQGYLKRGAFGEYMV